MGISSSVDWANKLTTRVHGDLVRAVGTNGGVVPPVPPDHGQTSDATVENFLREIAQDRPVRFSPSQLAMITRNYSRRLGSGGFGDVYLGALPSNGLAVAVKVLHGGGRRDAQSFMAEVGTIGRTHHVNLVRLLGYCFADAARALVYEYMEGGALDAFLLRADAVHVGAGRLLDIAVGVARGIRYLHEECAPKIVHYDIKPGNVLLDAALTTPKVADFGLAKLVRPAATHVSVSGFRGTPGYAAPELWMGSAGGGVTEKCDVYSFGMLLLEIVGRRRNFDEAAPESQQWFPALEWTKYQDGKLGDLLVPSSPSHGEVVERMCKVAFWCVQQRPEARPSMGVVVKALEGEMAIPPPVNPFQHLMAVTTAMTMTAGDTATTNALSERSHNLISF